MKDIISKIGVATVALASKYPAEQRNHINILLSKFKDKNIGISFVNEFIDTITKASNANDYFKKENIDLLLLQIGSWIPDELAVRVIEDIKVPLVLWVVPETLNDGNISTGSVVGFMQSGGVISKLGKKFEILFGGPEDENVIKSLNSIIKAIKAIKELRNSRIGLLGYHCPGMLDAGFHELELKNIIGPEIVYIDIAKLIDTFKKINTVSCKKFLNEINSKNFQIAGPTNDDLTEAVRLYLALKQIVEFNSLSGIAVRCWPELKELDIVSPCLALSMLTDEGIVASCEGDVLGAVSMQILYYLSGQAPFFLDVLRLSIEERIIFGFHCGAAATCLAENTSNVVLKTHFRGDKPADQRNWKPGVTAEFPVKPGRVTFARLDEMKGIYRMATYGGEAQSTEMFTRGNNVKVKMDGNVQEIINALVVEGFGHHQVLAHGNIIKELTILCKFLGIKCLEL